MRYVIYEGMAGYMPEGEPYECELEDLDAAVHTELSNAVDHLDHLANAYGDEEDYEAAWKTHKQAEEVDVLARNFDPKRREAPLYADNETLWLETVKLQVVENFPLDIGDHTFLYVEEVASD